MTNVLNRTFGQIMDFIQVIWIFQLMLNGRNGNLIMRSIFLILISRTREHRTLCFGTELEFGSQKTQYWMQLIQKIKKVYTGKLTYAANWDDFDKVPFGKS
jgi:hypothetical protein